MQSIMKLGIQLDGLIFAFSFLVFLSIKPAKIYAQDTSNQAIQENVIVLHGYGRSAVAMRTMERRLKRSGYRVHLVEYSSLMSSMAEIEDEVSQQIDQIIKQNPQKTHFIGHSLGGLLVRSYLGRHKVKQLGRVVTLGSPNKGTPVVEYFAQKWWFSLAGSAAQSLSSKGSQFLSSLPKPTYPLGVIAGLSKRKFAKKAFLKAPHDGLVSHESTRVEGMTDFTVIPANHTALRSNRAVFKEILNFLKLGYFKTH